MRTPIKTTRGIALLIVLGMLVLLSAIVVAFMSSVTTDLGASKSYEGGANARLLADSAVNLVIAQIREASTKPDEAWISQPGLIRTYAIGGEASAAYKLYSSNSMVVAGEFDPSKNEDLPPLTLPGGQGDWRMEPALWTDLNAPAVDPTRIDPATSKSRLAYPILDGNHLNQTGELALDRGVARDVEGFKVAEWEKTGVTMPVRWLYVLKDGTIAPATGRSGSLEIKVNAATKANPIVARMAFWTDDESSKVNVNTASEGTYWDTPVANSQPTIAISGNGTRSGYKPSADLVHDWDLAEFMGGQKEFQRYPGHPATTSLSPILGRQLALALGLPGGSYTSGPGRQTFVEAIYKLTPRVSGLGTNNQDWSSKGGTARAGGNQASTSKEVRPIAVDSDRLYPTLDEFAFNPLRVESTLAPNSRSREMLEVGKFFLTASSRAPEQNLFNKPRVAIWPVNADEKKRTAFDKLIAFCSTVGNRNSPEGIAATRSFIFDRRDPLSATADWSQSNAKIYDYLQKLTSRRIPGVSTNGAATFKAKYGSDNDQILTEIFDYIRCTNLVDTDSGKNDLFSYTAIKNPAKPTGNTLGDGTPSDFTLRGQVVPIELPNQTRGFGRVATISELALVVVRKNDSELPAAERTSKAKIEIAFFPELFCPMAGFSALANNIRIRIDATDFTVTDSSGVKHEPFKGTVQPDIYDVGRISNIEDDESKVGGIIGIRSLLEGPTPSSRYPRNQGSPADSVPPNAELKVAYSRDQKSDDERNSLVFQGKVVVKIYAPHGPVLSSPSLAPTQVITFLFPGPDHPTLVGDATPRRIQIPATPSGQFAEGAASGAKVKGEKIKGSNRDGMKMLDQGISVRSLLPNGIGVGGDVRIIAAKKIVENDAFGMSPRYSDRKELSVHGMRGVWKSEHLSRQGALVAGMTNYADDHRPDVPEGVVGVRNSAGEGDWDNGPHFVLDGPLCNKADEGTRRHEHGRQGVGSPYAEGSSPYMGWAWAPQDMGSQQDTFFSPNRQISSAVMFGSLSTGVKAQPSKPWQTLLFRPAKTYLPGGVNHPGSSQHGPPDHLLLDLFWMPIVEPYAISEPFATAGKINMNYQIAPFTYIQRDTGMRAVMKAVKITALNPKQTDRRDGREYISNYKISGSTGDNSNGSGGGGGQGVVNRRNIEVDATLKHFEKRFNENKPFISESEICDIPLVPAVMPGMINVAIPATAQPPFDSQLSTFWRAHKLTGDNSLERPYSHLYPRLTTRSNTYTVHLRVQSIRQTASADPTSFREGRDVVNGDFRGAFIIERYLDPNLQEFKNDNDQLGPYRFRVVSSKQFAL